jgi:hypothetical protein
MRLDWLRARLLLAIPVMGCGARAPRPQPPDEETEPEERVPERVVAAPTDASVEDAAYPPPHLPERCALAPDTVFEIACGGASVPKGSCPPHPEERFDVDTASYATMFVTDPRGSLAKFRFDPDRTDRYRMAHDGKGCCFVHCTEMEVAASVPAPRVEARYKLDHHAIPMPPGGTREPAAREPRCPAAIKIGTTLRPFELAADDRCYCTVVVRDTSVLGRPARIAGEAHIAGVAATDAWSTEIAIRTEDLDAGTRARLAAVWLDAARLEHASIAAFSNLALQLLVHGAPPALIAATHAAASDEVAHARLGFAIASRYAGRALGPARFAAAAALAAEIDLEALAIETFVDGGLGEALAAAQAATAAELATDPAIAATLRRLAEDEARHAELAWSIVAWCAAQRPDLVDTLQARLTASRPPPAPRDDLEHHGILATSTMRALHVEVVEIARACLARIGG